MEEKKEVKSTSKLAKAYSEGKYSEALEELLNAPKKDNFFESFVGGIKSVFFL